MSYKKLTAEEAAALINNGDSIGFSGFTAAGTPQVISLALSKRAEEEHKAGRDFKVSVFTGASTNDFVDGALSRVNAIDRRSPYQSNSDSRKGINNGNINYFDMHLSQLAQTFRYGFLGDIDVAIVEAADVTEDGEITLGTAVGGAPTFAHLAKRIIIERNKKLTVELKGMHDNYEQIDAPNRPEIPIYKPSDRIGSAEIKINPSKDIGIV